MLASSGPSWSSFSFFFFSLDRCFAFLISGPGELGYYILYLKMSWYHKQAAFIYFKFNHFVSFVLELRAMIEKNCYENQQLTMVHNGPIPHNLGDLDYSFGEAFALGARPVSTSVHQGKRSGGLSSKFARKLGFRFSKKALTPSVWSLTELVRGIRQGRGNILRCKCMVENLRLNQMGFFDGSRVAPHEGPVEIRRGRADILSDLSGQLESSRENLGCVRDGLIEEIAKMLGGRRENTASTDEVVGVGEAYQTR